MPIAKGERNSEVGERDIRCRISHPDEEGESRTGGIAGGHSQHLELQRRRRHWHQHCLDCMEGQEKVEAIQVEGEKRKVVKSPDSSFVCWNKLGPTPLKSMCEITPVKNGFKCGELCDALDTCVFVV